MANQWDSHSFSTGTVITSEFLNDVTTKAKSIISPVDFGAVGDGVTDDTTALQAALDSFVDSQTSTDTAFSSGKPRVLDLAGKSYLVSSPLKIANSVLGGAGYINGLVITNGKLIASATATWSNISESPAPVTPNSVPGYLFVIADRRTADLGEYGIQNITLANLSLHLNFKTGGVYLENTYNTNIVDVTIFNLGQNKSGVETSVGNSLYNVQGIQTKNGALLIDNLNVDGLDQTKGTGDLPTGSVATMGTIGVRQQTADFRHVNVIVSNVAQSLYYDTLTNGQINNCHPWANEVYVGPNAVDLMFSNCYWDNTDIKLHSFKHFFIGCHSLAGDPDYILYAQENNETADGLILSGCSFGTGTIIYDNNGFSWAAQKNLVISGCSKRSGDRFDNTIDSLVLGTTEPFEYQNNLKYKVQVHGTSGIAGYSATRWQSGTANGPRYVLAKSRGASVGVYSACLSGDNLGELTYNGDNGTTLTQVGASIRAETTSTWSGSANPAKLVFSTTNILNPIDRFELDNSGNFKPSVDVNGSVGTTTNRLENVYSKTLTLIDGITAPSTVTGHAQIYVDTADGDLKIKFADGTVKTIVTDT